MEILALKQRCLAGLAMVSHDRIRSIVSEEMDFSRQEWETLAASPFGSSLNRGPFQPGNYVDEWSERLMGSYSPFRIPVELTLEDILVFAIDTGQVPASLRAMVRNGAIDLGASVGVPNTVKTRVPRTALYTRLAPAETGAKRDLATRAWRVLQDKCDRIGERVIHTEAYGDNWVHHVRLRALVRMLLPEVPLTPEPATADFKNQILAWVATGTCKVGTTPREPTVFAAWLMDRVDAGERARITKQELEKALESNDPRTPKSGRSTVAIATLLEKAFQMEPLDLTRFRGPQEMPKKRKAEIPLPVPKKRHPRPPIAEKVPEEPIDPNQTFWCNWNGEMVWFDAAEVDGMLKDLEKEFTF